MPGPAAVLREIHRLRRHATELQSEIERLPRLLKGQQAKVARQEEANREAHDRLKRLKVDNLEREGQLKQTQQQIIKHQDQMNSASSKKEYDAFKTEIATDQQKCQRLEDEILNGLLELDERTAQLPALEKAVQQAKQEYVEFEKASAERHKHLTEQLAEALRALKDVEASLPEDVRQQYDRQVAARGEDALSAVQGRTCVACYTEITAQNANELLQERFVFCKSCGRMLYLAG